MAQHDYSIANQSGASFRSDLNNALSAIVSQNSGTAEPSTTYAYQMWADTTNGVMKLRNAANNAWITLYQLDGEWSVIPFENGSAAAPSIYFKDSGTDTGFFSAGTDQVNVTTGGTERVEWGTSEVVFNDVGGNYDFRVEGDTNANLLFIDASADAVGIGTSSPSYALDVNGVIQARTGASLILQNDSGNDNASIRCSGSSVGAASLLFNTAGSQRAVIDSSGRVGIGTTSPQHILHLSSSSSSNYLRIDGSASRSYFGYETKGTVIYAQDQNGNASPLSFNIGGNEAGRFDTSSRLLLGTSTSTNNIRVGQKLAVVSSGGAAGDNGGISLTTYAGSSDVGLAPVIDFQRSRGTTDGSFTEVVSGDVLGYLIFRGADGAGWSDAAWIKGEADGDWTTSGDTTDSPGRLVFSTTADGASSPTERMRITNGGNLIVDSAGNNPGCRVAIGGFNDAAYASSSGLGVFGNSHFSNGLRIGALAGSGSRTVTADANGTLSASSDSSLKQEVSDVEVGGIAELMQIHPKAYKWLSDIEQRGENAAIEFGFFADQVAPVIPSAAPKGNDGLYGFYDRALLAVMTKAIQEQQALISELQAKVAALESA